jgi:hypothetical protein
VSPRVAWSSYVEAAAVGIDYPNFKSAIAARQGPERAHLYADVWTVMYELQHAATPD